VAVAAPAGAVAAEVIAQIDAVPFGEMKEAFDERDALIAELQQAVIELANTLETQPPAGQGVTDPGLKSDIAALSLRMAGMADRLDRFEQRLVEQEASVKHTLAMLIEWLESDQKAAA